MALVRLDKCQAVYAGNLESVVHNASMVNGLFFNLGGLATGHREVRNIAVPATATLGTEEVLLHYTPEVMYDARKSGLKDFVVATGEIGRAYHLTVGDIITVSADAFTGTPVVNQFVIPADGSMKLVPSATVGTTRFSCRVIEQTTLGYDNAVAYAIQVVKA